MSDIHLSRSIPQGRPLSVRPINYNMLTLTQIFELTEDELIIACLKHRIIQDKNRDTPHPFIYYVQTSLKNCSSLN